ncbi:MAG: adenosine kinase [Rhodospirillaceae bacterium]|nr:adenosine kinase [Rhodospirillaceae bacterium]MCA8931677.1 adenosine kinase [Rhodospirillaceae bacterium]
MPATTKTASRYDVLGIGNAIVDVISSEDDAFVAAEGLVKGSMSLIDAARAEDLYERMGPGMEMSGGSAANTMAGLASLGAKVAFIGKVSEDTLGEVFRHDIQAIGVAYTTPPLPEEVAPTARSLVLVTPDAQRTMNTFLGASVYLGPDDVDLDMVTAARITYLEGYLFDRPEAQAAFQKAARAAHAAGREVALTLSDTFCVERHGPEFRALIDGHVDILFGNENEMQVLFGTSTLEDAFDEVRGLCEVVAITRSAKGSLVMHGPTLFEVPAQPVRHLVDTTGAGDQYAAGFLSGYLKGLHLAECAEIGSITAAEVIAHYGARPEVDLAELVAAKMK